MSEEAEEKRGVQTETGGMDRVVNSVSEAVLRAKADPGFGLLARQMFDEGREVKEALPVVSSTCA